MIFQHSWKAVLDGTKTQTRRLCKPGDFARNFWGTALGDDLRIGMSGDNNRIGRVFSQSRLKWQVLETYAVQPGRGQKAITRIRITGIRQERLQDISEEDAVAEGMPFHEYFVGYGGWSERSVNPRDRYAALWDTIHTKRGTRWNQNPLVWVLTFEAVQS